MHEKFIDFKEFKENLLSKKDIFKKLENISDEEWEQQISEQGTLMYDIYLNKYAEYVYYTCYIVYLIVGIEVGVEKTLHMIEIEYGKPLYKESRELLEHPYSSEW
jgi:hypothetical protein